MSKNEIIQEINQIVYRYKKLKYSVWSIGVTDTPNIRKQKHGNPKCWKQWNAGSEKDARDIEKYFLNNGCKQCPESEKMKIGTRGNGHTDYVYMY